MSKKKHASVPHKSSTTPAKGQNEKFQEEDAQDSKKFYLVLIIATLLFVLFVYYFLTS